MKKYYQLSVLFLFLPFIGVAQQESLNVTDAVTFGSKKHEQAFQKITASNKIEESTHVLYEAGKSVELKPGFATTKGAAFKATVTPLNRLSENADPYISSSPNPYSEKTEVSYFVPKAGKVSVMLNNVVGVPISVLVDNEQQEAGLHKVSYESPGLISGTYLVVLRMDKTTISSKLVKE